MFSRVRLPALVWAALFVDLILVSLFLFDSLGGRPLGRYFSGMVDLAGERNLPAWYSSIKLCAVGSLLAIVAADLKKGGIPQAWLVVLLAGLFFGLSLDESAGIHEQLGFAIDRWLLAEEGRTVTAFHRTGIWMFVLVPPLLGVMTWIVVSLSSTIGDRQATQLFVAGLCVFLLGAGSDVLINFAEGHWQRVLQVAVEESAEMLGVTLVLWSVCRILVHRGLRLWSDGAAAAVPTIGSTLPVGPPP
jgi:hypothetical protein